MIKPLRRRSPALVGVLLSLGVLLVVSAMPASLSAAVAGQSGGWGTSFDGTPSSPLAWNPPDWDVQVHSRDRDTWKELEPMAAHHGPDCSAPPATHLTSSYEQAVYQCNNHVMTAINAGGYGAIYLTPNQLVDFSSGEAVVQFNMSTFRSANRDWADVWLSPFEDQLTLPLQAFLPDLTGEPRRAVHINMDSFNGGSVFRTSLVRNFVNQDLDGIWWMDYESFLAPSAVRRDTFELRISRTSLKFGMPQYDKWWVDTSFPDLGWDKAVLQLGHHSYTPMKECGRRGGCAPNTWHWDELSISHAQPFTMLKAEQAWVDEETSTTVTFPGAAPEGSFLRFSGIGADLQVSFDGGQSWQDAQMQRVIKVQDEVFRPYWTPVPPGTSSVEIRGKPFWGGGWMARGISIWSETQP
jgi:hypothetical protein